MSDAAVKDALVRIAGPVVRSLGLDIWGVEITQTGRPVVRLFVEAPLAPEDTADGMLSQAAAGGREEAPDPSAFSATIAQCEEISRRIGLALDVEDIFPQAYVLEVSTPGFNRLFFSPAQMRPYIGDMIEARMPSGFTPEGVEIARRVWRGRLTAVEEGAFRLAPAVVSAAGDVTPEALPEVRIPWEATRRVARLYVFHQPARPGKPSGGGKRRKSGDEGRGGRERGRAPMPNEALDGLDI
ncbi:ribosome maturation factor RimP [Desulfovibrio sp.]|uniref:ribosome maturation factor RimP n=1 Tax=Desulfovibrio sp. TaxID=885 RepID=UPI0025BB35A7|nr:ribosome maturation factor RimP [Desulfovibrio sp.]MCI7569427.1 ribosome maturation factor RimP [Desulfovibrio sp.]